MPPVRPLVPDGAPIYPKEIFGGGSRAPAEETEVGAGATVSEAVPPWPPELPAPPWPPELPAPPWPPELPDPPWPPELPDPPWPPESPDLPWPPESPDPDLSFLPAVCLIAPHLFQFFLVWFPCVYKPSVSCVLCSLLNVFLVLLNPCLQLFSVSPRSLLPREPDS